MDGAEPPLTPESSPGPWAPLCPRCCSLCVELRAPQAQLWGDGHQASPRGLPCPWGLTSNLRRMQATHLPAAPCGLPHLSRARRV